MPGPIATLIIRIQGDVSGFGKSMAEAESTLAGSAKRMSSLGSSLTKGLTVPLVALGGLAIASALSVEKGYHIIEQKTGDVNAATDGLGKSFKTVLGNVPQSVTAVADTMSMLKIRFNETGKPLETLTKQVLDLSRITGTDATTNVDLITRAFANWNIATKDQGKDLDYLYGVSTHTGVGIDQLMSGVAKSGAIFRGFGFSFQQSTAMIGLFEKAGLNTQQVMMGMRTGLAKISKDAQDPKAFATLISGLHLSAKAAAEAGTALKSPTTALPFLITQIKDAGSAADATAIATAVFGTRAGPALADAIRSGRLEVGQLVDSLNKAPASIEKVADKTMSLTDKFKELKNKGMIAIEPLGKSLVDALESVMPFIGSVIKGIGSLAQGFEKLPMSVRDGIVAFGLLLAAMGPVISIAGKVEKTFSAVAKVGSALGAGAAKIIGYFTTTSIAATTSAATIDTAGGTAIAGGAEFEAAGHTAAMGGMGFETVGAAATTSAAEIDTAGAAAETGGGGFVAAAGGIAGIVAPLAILAAGAGIVYHFWNEAKKVEAAFESSTKAASDAIPAYNNLVNTTGSLTTGSDAWKSALERQEATAKKMSAATYGLGSSYDTMGNIMTVNTGYITADQQAFDKATAAQKKNAAERLAGVGDVAKSVDILDKDNTALNEQGKANDRLLDKMRKGKVTWEDIAKVEQDMGTKLKNVKDSYKNLEDAVSYFGMKLEANGLRAMTFKDTQGMIAVLNSAKPEVKLQGMQMFQEICDAETKKHPEIAAGMQSISADILQQIQNMKPGELTTTKMIEMIAAEKAAHPECAGAMDEIIASLTSSITGADLKGKTTAQMAGIIQAIAEAKGPIAAGAVAIAGAITNVFSGIHLQIPYTYTATNSPPSKSGFKLFPLKHAGGPILHGGGIIDRFQSGGLKSNEVPSVLELGEFVMQNAAVDKYGVDFMKAINQGTYRPNPPVNNTSVRVDAINLHSVSPEYDAKKLRKLLLDPVSTQAAHLRRVTP